MRSRGNVTDRTSSFDSPVARVREGAADSHFGRRVGHDRRHLPISAKQALLSADPLQYLRCWPGIDGCHDRERRSVKGDTFLFPALISIAPVYPP